MPAKSSKTSLLTVLKPIFLMKLGDMTVNPLKHSVAALIQNSPLLKYIPEISNEFFTFIIFLQIAFTVLGIGVFFNSGRISA